MNQKQLRKTIESFSTRTFSSSKDLLTHVVTQIVRNDSISIKGGRVWQLKPGNLSYQLIAQVGAVQHIEENFELKVAEYKVFQILPKKRTLVLAETSKYLRSKGIRRYSATGVGDIRTVGSMKLFEFILSFNANLGHDQAGTTLDIIGLSVTEMLRSWRSERKSKALAKELDQARKIQKSILPEHEMYFHNYEIFGVSVADREVGGDFFDYIENDEKDRLAIVIGDAASKGMSAAVQALYVSGALRMGASFQTKIGTLIQKINVLVNRIFLDERFITLCYCELTNDARGLCVYVNAGHNSPILYHVNTGTSEMLESTGVIIGPFPDQVYRRESAMIDRGDVLLLYTDGISEAVDGAGTLYSEKRLAKTLARLKDRSAKQIAQEILEHVELFSAKGKLSDDKTVVVIKRVK